MSRDRKPLGQREAIGVQRGEHHVQRHELGERRRLRTGIGIGLVQYHRVVHVVHDRGVGRSRPAGRRRNKQTEEHKRVPRERRVGARAS